MDGFISYPRTDNTVYPKSLPVRELLQSIAQVDAFKEAAPIAAQREARADARQEGDDRPPADLPDPGARPDGAARRRPPQDLRARRAPLPRDVRRPGGVGVDARRHRGRHARPTSCAATCWSSRASSRSIRTGARRTRRSRRSRRARSSRSPTSAPLTRPDANPWFDAKETQPPSRIGQGKLIEMMEERGLGTKATRHDIIQKLYDRGYIQNNPIEPSETGIAMVKAFQQYAERDRDAGHDRRARGRHGQDRRRAR